MPQQGLIWYRGGEIIATFPTHGDPLNAGVEIRNWLDLIRNQVRPASDILQCHGEADFGADLHLELPSCTYAAGDGGCTWTTRVMIDKTEHKPLGTPGFILGKYGVFRGMKFVGRCHDPNEDGGLIGWNAEMNATAGFYDCEFDAAEACDWSFYNWTPGLKHVTVQGGSGKFCRFGFAMMDSGSNSQSILLQDFKATLAADGSKTYGESSNNNPETGAVLTTVAIRGGKATLRNVEVEAAGLTATYDKTGKYGVSRVASLCSDTYYSAGQPVDITLENCTSRITPNTSKVWNDVDVRGAKSTVKVLRKEGSAADGSLKLWKP